MPKILARIKNTAGGVQRNSRSSNVFYVLKPALVLLCVGFYSIFKCSIKASFSAMLFLSAVAGTEDTKGDECELSKPRKEIYLDISFMHAHGF